MSPGEKRGRWIRHAGIAAAAAASAWIAAAIVVPRLVDEEALRVRAERRLAAALGRPISVAGARLSVLAGPRVEIQGIRIEEDPESLEETWTGGAESASVGVAVLPLLRGAMEARSVRWEGLEVARGSRLLLRDGVGRARLRRDASGGLRARGRAGGRAAILPGAPRGEATFAVRRAGEELGVDTVDLALGPLRLRAAGAVSGLSEEVPVARFEGTATIGRTAARGDFELFLEPEAPRLEFRVTSPFVDVDELIDRWTQRDAPPRAASSGWFPAAHASVSPGPSAVSWLAAIEADGTLDADGGRWRGITLGSCASRVSARGGRLRFDDVRCEVHGGRGEGTLEARVAEEGLPFALEARLRGVELSTLSAEISSRAAGVLEGRAALEVALEGRAAEEPIVATLAGTARLAATEGRIKSVGLLKRLGELLQMAGGRGETDETPFERLTANLRIEGGAARTDDLEFRSVDLDLDGGGTVALDGALALDVVAALSREASAAVVERTPQLRFRVGPDGRLTVPMKLRGTLGSPYVQVDLEKVLEEGLRDQMRKRGEKSLLRRLLGR